MSNLQQIMKNGGEQSYSYYNEFMWKGRMEEVIRKHFQGWLDKDIDVVKEICNDDIIYSEC